LTNSWKTNLVSNGQNLFKHDLPQNISKP